MSFETLIKNSFKLYSPYTEGRKPLEKFISKVFKRVYNAELKFFHQNLLTVQSEGIEGAIGFSSCENAIFLEQYLDLPIEEEIYRLSMIKTGRHNIAEVGNLAAIRNGSGAKLMIAMTECLLLYGYKFATFTGTNQIFSIFNKLGYTPMIITCAEKEKVSNSNAWGSYYEYSPRVAVADLNILKSRLLKVNPVDNTELFNEVRECLVRNLLEA